MRISIYTESLPNKSPETLLAETLRRIAVGATVGCYDLNETDRVSRVHMVRRETPTTFSYEPVDASYAYAFEEPETIVLEENSDRLRFAGKAVKKWGRTRNANRDLQEPDIRRWSEIASRSVRAAETPEGFVPADPRDVRIITEELKALDAIFPLGVEYTIDLDTDTAKGIYLRSFSGKLGREVDAVYSRYENKYWDLTRSITLATNEGDLTGLPHGLRTAENLAPFNYGVLPSARSRAYDDPAIVRLPAVPLTHHEAVTLKKAVMAVSGHAEVLSSDGESRRLIDWASRHFSTEQQMKVFAELDVEAASPVDIEQLLQTAEMQLMPDTGNGQPISGIRVHDEEELVEIMTTNNVLELHLWRLSPIEGSEDMRGKLRQTVRVYNGVAGEYNHPQDSKGVEEFLQDPFLNLNPKALQIYERRFPDIIPSVVFRNMIPLKKATVERLTRLIKTSPYRMPIK